MTQSRAHNRQSRLHEPAPILTGAQAVIASLEAEGVELVFGYPGGSVLAIYDALYASPITHITARHEQGAVHEADGYARATGKVGVVLVTSGPGASNTVTGIATAYMDSVPLVIVTGQVPTTMIGTDAFQESDIMGMSMPVVKHSFLVKSAALLPETFRAAFHIARTGRPGPVLIDIPSDVAAQTLEFIYPSHIDLPSYKPTYKGNARQIKQAVATLSGAKRPVILAGGGIVSSGARAELHDLAHALNAPVVTTLMGKGALPESDPLCFGFAGMHGSKFANQALCEADVLLACGTRFSDRVTGNPECFAKDARIIHIDIDPAEIGKVIPIDVPIVGDVRIVLAALLERLEKEEIALDTSAWLEHLTQLKARYPFERGTQALEGGLSPELVCAKLSLRLDPLSSIVTTEVGQHQMWAAQLIERDVPRSFITSGGLGTMGFGFPAAIGAALGRPDKQIVCIAGDGSFQMCEQEMATAIANNAQVKVLVFDNRSLGMVRQQQQLFCGGRYIATKLDAVPDFVKLADAYGWHAARVEDPDDLDKALDDLLACKGPALLDVMVARDHNVYPMVVPGACLDEALGVFDAALTVDGEGEA
ncbi:MAG: biosynthetic-type acetolactate synthase large subunit [Eggerthellaceae bacterium]|nr:biosynthetic-type acetolactate synthase large subunit [Eggerthellaceae bacterium]